MSDDRRTNPRPASRPDQEVSDVDEEYSEIDPDDVAEGRETFSQTTRRPRTTSRMAPESNTSDAGAVTLPEWVQRRLRRSDLVSSSEPEPVLLQHNAVAVSRDNDAARSVVLAWERILPEDGAVGFLALGTPPERRDAELGHVEHGADGAVGHAADRVVRGSIPGAVIGAVVVTVFVWVVMGWTPVLIGAALGGAAFGFVAGFMISFATGTGWGAAYRDSFVDDERTELLVASIHADAEQPIAQAIEAVKDVESVELYVVDRAGATSRVP